eukprot:gene27503-33217_t
MEQYDNYEPDNADLDGLVRTFNEVDRNMSFRAPPEDLLSAENSVDLGENSVILDENGNTPVPPNPAPSYLSPLELVRQKVYEYCKVDLRSADIDLLFERFDHDRSGDLDYKDGARIIPPKLKEDTDAILARVRRGIEDYLGPGSQSAKKVKEVFAEFDRNGNCRISGREFKEALRMLKVDLRSADIDLLFERFDHDRSGDLDYKEFLDLLGLAGNGSADSGARIIPPKLKEDTDAILDRIRRGIEDYLGPGIQSAKRVKEVFAEFDRNGNGRISTREFKEALRILKSDSLLSYHLPSLFILFDTSKTGKITPVDFAVAVSRRLDLELSGSEIMSLFSEFDEDRSGDLDVNEFAALLDIHIAGQPPSSPSRPPSAVRNSISAMGADICVEMLRRTLDGNKSVAKLGEIFHELDLRKRNRLNIVDLYEGINLMMDNKQVVSMRQCEYIMSRFDHDKSNDLDFREFLLMFGVDPDSGELVGAVPVEYLENEIQAAAREYLALNHNAPSKLKDLFAYFDPACRSRVNKHDLRLHMAKLFGIDILFEELDALFLKYDVDESGDLNYGEFLSLIGCRAVVK